MCLPSYHIKSVYFVITWCLSYYHRGKILSTLLLYLECLSYYHIIVSILLSHIAKSVYLIVTKKILPYYHIQSVYVIMVPHDIKIWSLWQNLGFQHIIKTKLCKTYHCVLVAISIKNLFILYPIYYYSI